MQIERRKPLCVAFRTFLGLLGGGGGGGGGEYIINIQIMKYNKLLLFY